MRALWITGLVLMVAPFVVALVMFGSSDGWDAFVGAIIWTFVIGPIMFVVGLVLLIAGLAAGGGQRQQQQVVVYTGGGHCQHCGTPLDGGQRFCSGCGTAAG